MLEKKNSDFTWMIIALLLAVVDFLILVYFGRLFGVMLVLIAAVLAAFPGIVICYSRYKVILESLKPYLQKVRSQDLTKKKLTEDVGYQLVTAELFAVCMTAILLFIPGFLSTIFGYSILILSRQATPQGDEG